MIFQKKQNKKQLFGNDEIDNVGCIYRGVCEKF